ncbi:MAG: hypothetical protein VX768_00745 [Planctomycetota bacterium]|nr:hypothetical protein [Planctomycetota bacterium]
MSTPLILYGMGALGWSCFVIYETAQRTPDPSMVLFGAGGFALGAGLIVLTLRSVLNPSQVGVVEEPSATFAETLLGISAVLSRAPMYSSQIIYPISMVILCLGSVLFILAQFIGSSVFLIGVLSMLSIGGLGVFFPILAYVVAFSGMLTIELFQAIFDIRRNTKLSK